MVTLKEVMDEMNKMLAEGHAEEHVEMRRLDYEYNGEKRYEDFLVIAHPKEPERGIAISYDDDWQEWKVEYFGTHEHFSCRTLDSFMFHIYGMTILPILCNYRMVAYGKKGTPYEGEYRTRDIVDEEIGGWYTDEEVEMAKNFGARNWAGEDNDLATVLHILFGKGEPDEE